MFHVVPGFANRKIDFGQNLAIFWSNLPFLTFKCELLHFHVFWNSYIFWNLGLKFGTNHLCIDIKKFSAGFLNFHSIFEKMAILYIYILKFMKISDFFDICPLFFKTGHDIKNLADQFFISIQRSFVPNFSPKFQKM